MIKICQGYGKIFFIEINIHNPKKLDFLFSLTEEQNKNFFFGNLNNENKLLLLQIQENIQVVLPL